MRSRIVGPLAFCRMGPDLTDRIQEHRDLLALLLEAGLWMATGSAVYGAVLGGWRAPLQGAYAAIRLPILLATLAAVTFAANGVFAKLSGSRLGLVQMLCCSMISMATLAIILGSLAPVSILISASTPSYGESLVGVSRSASMDAVRNAEILLAYHVMIIGVAGLISLRRLRSLFGSLIGSSEIASRLFWLCFLTLAVAGTQLSWILRPYLGKPQIPVAFLRPDAVSGSFSEEVARWLM